ncbi:MAG TPA: hypothetical protein VJ799_01505 [Nitrososphaeraceae archaeon]|nr:hypothetical protein [Nitrososphaeraceae archaeon]
MEIYHAVYKRMLFEFVVSIFVKTSAAVFKWLDQNMLVYILTYSIYHIKTSKEVTQVVYYRSSGRMWAEGNTDGLRLVFSTYDAAESYAQFYRGSYNEQYNFRIIGVKKD